MKVNNDNLKKKNYTTRIYSKGAKNKAEDVIVFKIFMEFSLFYEPQSSN